MSLYYEQNRIYVFLYIVLLAVRMVADVTEARQILVWNSKLELVPSLEFKT